MDRKYMGMNFKLDIELVLMGNRKKKKNYRWDLKYPTHKIKGIYVDMVRKWRLISIFLFTLRASNIDFLKLQLSKIIVLIRIHITGLN